MVIKIGPVSQIEYPCNVCEDHQVGCRTYCAKYRTYLSSNEVFIVFIPGKNQQISSGDDLVDLTEEEIEGFPGMEACPREPSSA